MAQPVPVPIRKPTGGGLPRRGTASTARKPVAGSQPSSAPRASSRPAPAIILAALAALLVAVGVARIVLTYAVFNQAYDEPAHIGSGMEWLDRGTYTYEVQHPPLARVAVALGPYLAGARSHHQQNLWMEGNAILYGGAGGRTGSHGGAQVRAGSYESGAYLRTLAVARMGVLPFFLLAALAVWLWTRHLFGTRAAAAAVALFTTLPPVLAHAGLATTDMPVAAALTLALYAFTRYLARPSLARGALLGGAVALAVLCKLSALVFIPACGGAILATWWLAERWRARARGADLRPKLVRLARPLPAAAAIALLLTWAAYRFSTGRVYGVPVLFPELFLGMREVAAHNSEGHAAYLMGEVRRTGWWYFFPVALAVKTPLPFLALALGGAAVAVRRAYRGRDWRSTAPVLAAAVILAISMLSTINIGVRHILPIYPLLAVVAGFGAALLWGRPGPGRAVRRGALGVGALWLAAGSARAHPDYLSYFNELAANRREPVLVDSDLDWGQDLRRLADTVRARRIGAISLAYWGSADPRRHGLPNLRCLRPVDRVSGWVAASEASVRGLRRDRSFTWLRAYGPVTRAGKSIRLYYVPPGPGLSAAIPSTLACDPLRAWQSPYARRGDGDRR